MSNPRRSFSLPQSLGDPNPPVLSSVVLFLRRPHAFPFLLSAFILLTWLSLRLQNRHVSLSSSSSLGRASLTDADADANVVRFGSLEFPSRVGRDKRGWLVNPVEAARDAGLSGHARSCVSVHVGEIRPGSIRGNHRHHTCNETFIIWGAETKFRVENPHLVKGYAEVVIHAEEVAIAVSPSGTGHALMNVDRSRTTFLLGCQDSVVNYTNSETDFNIWKDL